MGFRLWTTANQQNQYQQQIGSWAPRTSGLGISVQVTAAPVRDTRRRRRLPSPSRCTWTQRRTPCVQKENTSSTPCRAGVPPYPTARPNLFPRRRSSLSSVTTWRAPVQPSGWPRAMAPPLGFTLSSGIPSVSTQYTAWRAGEGQSSCSVQQKEPRRSPDWRRPR